MACPEESAADKQQGSRGAVDAGPARAGARLAWACNLNDLEVKESSQHPENLSKPFWYLAKG